MYWKIRKLKEDLIGALLGLIIAFFVVTYVMSLDKVLIENSSDTSIDNPLHINFNKEFKYCRNVTYTRDTKVTIYKAFVKNLSTGEMISIPYGTYTYFRKAVSNKDSCKVMTFTREMLSNSVNMDNRYGEWVIETYVEILHFPFWKTQQKMNNIYLYVDKGDKND